MSSTARTVARRQTPLGKRELKVRDRTLRLARAWIKANRPEVWAQLTRQAERDVDRGSLG